MKTLPNDASTYFASFHWAGEEVQMTKQLILQKTETQRIKIRLVYHNSYRFRITPRS
jgi:hypothetical protein